MQPSFSEHFLDAPYFVIVYYPRAKARGYQNLIPKGFRNVFSSFFQLPTSNLLSVNARATATNDFFHFR